MDRIVTRVLYEWAFEVVGMDEWDRDILECDYYTDLVAPITTYLSMPNWADAQTHPYHTFSARCGEASEPCYLRLALCRNQYKCYQDESGEEVMHGSNDREYAYVTKDGNLPDEFEYGTKVPKYKHEEFSRSPWAHKFYCHEEEPINMTGI